MDLLELYQMILHFIISLKELYFQLIKIKNN